MKKTKISSKMSFYFFLITLLLFLLFWLVQLLFLGGRYTNKKIQQLIELGNTVKSEIEIKTLEHESVKKLIYNEGLDVKILDRAAHIVAAAQEKAVSDDGKVSSFFSLYYECAKNIEETSKPYVCYRSLEQNFNVYVYGTRIMYNGEFCYLFISSPTAPFDAGRQIITWQLLILTACICAFSALVSFVFSKRFSKPIENMSIAARKLAKGDYSVRFEGNSSSEINELADTLNYVKDELKETDTLRKDVMANVSHDLKTPLTMIRAYAEMIKDISGENKEKREKHTQVIIDEADRLTKLVNDMMNLNKIMSETIPQDRKVFDLSILVHSVIEHFGIYSERENYIFERDIDMNLYIKADEQKIEQAVYNLLGNAVNYTGADKRVIIRLKAQSKNTALLEIIDTGKGIPEEEQKTIWDKYYRYSESHGRSVKGSGLGLSIVKAILDSHGLEYGVKSKLDEGCNFYILFKCQTKDIKL